MARQRIALIFDNVVRPDTTGGYCLKALRELHDVRHFLPDQMQTIPRSGFDLYLNIDDGLRYHLPKELRPCAWWVIDTHMDPAWAEEKGKGFDFLFAAQRDGAQCLVNSGIPTDWLPLACDPEVHRPHALQRTRDVCFVGRNTSGTRRKLLSLILNQFPNSFVGERYFEDFATTYSESKIGFNCSVKNDVNMRVFETLACGPLLVTNDLADNGQEELFTSDKHLVTYREPEEMLEKIRFYLRHEEVRQAIAQSGQIEATTRHTYRHRMISLLESIERSKSTTVLRYGRGISNSFAAVGRRNGIDIEFTTIPIESIDFIIKTFLRPHALLRLLNSIWSFYPDACVTVADDGNLRGGRDHDSQACCDFIDSNPRYRLLSLSFAAGVSAGRNHLIDQTTRPFVLILDDDFCFTDQTKIEQLAGRLANDEKVGIVAGACIDVLGSNRQRRNSGGTMQVESDRLIITSGAWRDRAAGIREYVPQFAIIRREVFDEIRWEGGIGAEHYDFLLQIMKSRWTTVHDESVTIDHHPLSETLPDYPRYRFDFEAAQQWLLVKWGLRQIVQDGQPIVELSPLLSRNSAEPISGGATRPDKDAPYFEFDRPEVVALIPTSARRVLDIGCGAGRLGELLKRRQPTEVTGIELKQEAAARAATRLDRVLVQNVEERSFEFPPESFDCVVCADVLEHLREPALVLTKIRRWLAPGGTLVLSLPNTRHHSVISGLLDGNWTYESAGLLDNDHVRFFTRREIEKLLFRQRFEIVSLLPKPGPGHPEWVAAGRPGTVRVGPMQIAGLTSDVAEEFFTYQYLVVARPDSTPFNRLHLSSVITRKPVEEFHLTSIIIVTFNELAYTRECVDSIRLRTDEPYELIFVDNGSTDGTPEYLKSLGDVQIIRNSENRGFPAAVNQGIRVARGNQVLLLNNDTVVSTGWLRKLLVAFERDGKVGLAGPCSNRVSGRQMVEATYSDMTSMDGFAWDWGRRHAGVTEETDRLIGFCLLIRKTVLDQIGLMDERFGIGCFEDDDICQRALRGGWKAVIVRDAFVHHYGSRTFAATGLDFDRLMDENRRKYQDKWTSRQRPNPIQPHPFSFVEAEGGGLLLVRKSQPRLSLCMIVRNNEGTIGPCLESIQPWVDEMIVVDTGSTDSTPGICRKLGARVFEWPWRDDFSAARNESFKHATGEWLFWMDSDDTIPEDCGRRLRQLADGQHPPEILGYVIQVHCPGPIGSHDVTAVDHVKLVRNRPDLRFEHRIHEQILPAIRRAGGDVAFTDIHVIHSGADHTPDGRQRKLNRDFKLLELDLAERPDHPFVLFNLGMTHADCEQYENAIDWLKRCLEISHPAESHVRKAYALLVSSLMQVGDLEAADTFCQQGRCQFPEDVELLFRQAMLAHERGDLDTSVRLYLQLLDLPDSPRHFSSVDVGISGFKARHNLAIVFEEQGLIERAEREWRTILSEQPSYVAAKVGLVECLLQRGDFAEASKRIDQLRSDDSSVGHGYRLSGRLAEIQEDAVAAIEQLNLGLKRAADDTGLLRELARLLHASGDYSAALTKLERLTELDTGDSSAWHNQGVVLGLLGRNEESRQAFSLATATRIRRTALR